MFTIALFLVLLITIIRLCKSLCNKNANNSKQNVNSDDPDVDNKLLQKV